MKPRHSLGSSISARGSAPPPRLSRLPLAAEVVFTAARKARGGTVGDGLERRFPTIVSQVSCDVTFSPFLLKEHSQEAVFLVLLLLDYGPTILQIEVSCLMVSLECFKPNGRMAPREKLIFAMGK